MSDTNASSSLLDAERIARANALTRRRFLRGTAIAAGGVAVATVAACAPAATAWQYTAPRSMPGAALPPAGASGGASPAASAF